MKYSHRADRVYFSARQRCNNKNCKAYKNYGGRGIKCLMTKEDFRMLWDRDKADKLEKPSIDRINVDGDYTVKNCRFIELRENAGVRRKNINKFCPSGHPYTGSNLHIKMYHGKKTRSCRACAVKHRKKHMEKVVGESLRKKDEVIAHLKEILKGRDEALKEIWNSSGAALQSVVPDDAKTAFLIGIKDASREALSKTWEEGE